MAEDGLDDELEATVGSVRLGDPHPSPGERREEFDLPDRVLRQGHGPREGVEVVLEERPLLKAALWRRIFTRWPVRGTVFTRRLLPDALDIAGRQFEAGVGKAGARLVRDSQPSAQTSHSYPEAFGIPSNPD